MYASYDDYTRRNPDTIPGSKSYIETALADASQLLDDLYPRETASAEAATLQRIVCSMVARKVAQSTVGVKSTQIGAGPYQETLSYTNPHGDMYLTALEKRALGVGKQQAFTIPAYRTGCQ